MRRLYHDYYASIARFTINARLYLLSTVIAGVANSFFFVLYNLYLRKLGFGPDFPGIIISLTSASAVLFSLPAGRLSDLLGSRRLMVWSSALILPFAFGRALAANYWPLLGHNFMIGTVSTLSMVAVVPFLTENSTSSERTHLVSISMALNVATGFLGSYLGGALPGFFAQILQWNPEGAPAYRLTLFVGAFLLLLSVIPLLWIRERGPAREKIRNSQTSRHSISSQSLSAIIGLGTIQLLIGLGAGMFVPFMNMFMADVLRLPTAAIGTWFALSSLTQAAGMLIAPIFSNRFGKVRTIVACQGLSIPFILMLAFFQVPALAVPAFLLRTMLMNMNNGLFNVLSMEVVEDKARGIMSGVTSMVFSIGWVIGPFTSGLIIRSYGYRPVFLTAAILYTIAAILLGTMFGSAESRQAPTVLSQ